MTTCKNCGHEIKYNNDAGELAHIDRNGIMYRGCVECFVQQGENEMISFNPPCTNPQSNTAALPEKKVTKE